MLPEPTLSFTLPSVHDNTTLDCRVYHPHSLAASPRAPPWRRHAAVVAHPYAPLGGCFDDPVVDTVAGTLLRSGFVVGTFNFRGAGNSAGHTSWTSKAEKADYMSLVGFISYYVHHLDPFRAAAIPTTDTHPTSPGPAPADAPRDSDDHGDEKPLPPPVLLLAGYSYGAMITSQIPPLDTILDPFVTPAVGSAEAEIRLRAQHLAEQQNVILGSARAALVEHRQHQQHGHSHNSTGQMSPRKSLGLRIGGDEGSRRRSHELQGRRSFSLDAEDKLRKGVADLMAKTKTHRRVTGHGAAAGIIAGGSGMETPTKGSMSQEKQLQEQQQQVLGKLEDMRRPAVAYLLVSPPLGWAASLLTLKFPSPFGKRSTKSPAKGPSPLKDNKSGSSSHEHQLAEQKLVEHPCLTVYGDADSFTAAKKFREWTTRLQGVPGSRFRAHEISTAGHFYIEEGVMHRLRDAVRAFADGLLSEESA